MGFLEKFKKLFIESFKDNKKLIIGLYFLLIVSIIVSWILSATSVEAIMPQMGVHKIPSTPVNDVGVSPVDLFINNEMEEL